MLRMAHLLNFSQCVFSRGLRGSERHIKPSIHRCGTAQEILDIAPAVSSLKINLEDGIGGLIRSFSGHPQGDGILQRCMAMRNLHSLVFDFLADTGSKGSSNAEKGRKHETTEV